MNGLVLGDFPLEPASVGEGSLRHAKFETPLPAGGSVELPWKFRGDPPHVRHVVWWTELDEATYASGAAPGATTLTVPVGDVALLHQFARSSHKELELRSAFAADTSRPHAHHRAFFADLDRRTLPDAGAASPVDLVSGYLRSRYLVRAEDAGLGDLAQFSALEVELLRKPAVLIAGLLEGLLSTHYRGHANGLDYSAVAEAFHRFAGGQLTEFGTHGAPSGTNFFSLCEFALLLWALDHNRAFRGAAHRDLRPGLRGLRALLPQVRRPADDVRLSRRVQSQWRARLRRAGAA